MTEHNYEEFVKRCVEYGIGKEPQEYKERMVRIITGSFANGGNIPHDITKYDIAMSYLVMNNEVEYTVYKEMYQKEMFQPEYNRGIFSDEYIRKKIEEYAPFYKEKELKECKEEQND